MLRLCFLFLLVVALGYGKHKSSTKSQSTPLSAMICNSAGWSDSDRYGIISIHNNLRSSIASGKYNAKGTQKPPATDMEQMNYDCDLESSAQAWAATCPKGHSRSAGKGENIYWKWSTAPIPIAGQGQAASNSWANEFQQYGWPSNILTTRLFNLGIGHATQMAWWNSNRVGCGIKQCSSNLAGYKYEIVVVCQYTPQGNIINQPIYASGPTCSECAGGMYCDYNTGLCV